LARSIGARLSGLRDVSGNVAHRGVELGNGDAERIFDRGHDG
jgi:hypothetical protein